MTAQQKAVRDQRVRSARRIQCLGSWVTLRALTLALGAATGTMLTAAPASAQTEATGPEATGPVPESNAERQAPAEADASTTQASPEKDATTPEARVFHPEPAGEPPEASPASDTAKAASNTTEATPEQEEAARKLQFFPVNIGLVSPIEVIPKASTRRFGMHLSALYGDIGASDGFHVDGLVGRVRQDTVGFGASGLWTDVGGTTQGYETAGLVHRVKGSMRGAQTAGLVALSGDANGLQAGGILTMAGNLEGAQFGGVLTLARKMNGAQFGGITTFAADAKGMQTAGIVARADAFKGAQIAGIANLATELKGVQIGLVNHTRGSVRGAQIGLVNLAKKVDGAQVGLVNLAGNTRHQAVIWTDEQLVAQAGWRTSWKPLYSQVGFGINPRGFESTDDDRKELVPSYAFGGRIPLGDLFLDLDVLYSVELSANRWHHGESAAHAIRQRVAVGYQVADWLALTAGAGIRQRWNTDGEFDLGPTVFGGLQLF